MTTDICIVLERATSEFEHQISEQERVSTEQIYARSKCWNEHQFFELQFSERALNSLMLDPTLIFDNSKIHVFVWLGIIQNEKIKIYVDIDNFRYMLGGFYVNLSPLLSEI